MRLDANSVLITGGATGIGLALAERFLAAGSEVAICGRREEKLVEAREKHPRLKTRVCDLALETDRVLLRDWALSELPGLNVLVNNAGIQNRFRIPDAPDWDHTREEIAINLESPIHLSILFIPHLRAQESPAILNVTSGLGFVPLVAAPIYSATKAAMHSFTQSLRNQLAGTPIQVIEIIPPSVNTDLGGPGLHTTGVDLNEFADTVMAGLSRGDHEVTHSFSQKLSRASRDQLDEIFARMNQPR